MSFSKKKMSIALVLIIALYGFKQADDYFEVSKNLEIFRFNEFFTTLLRVILSTIGTFCFVYVVQFLFYKTDKNK